MNRLTSTFIFYNSTTMNIHDYITISPEVQFGTPVFNGTRIMVSSLFLYLEKDITLNEFLKDFPSVSKQQCEGED